MNQRRACLALAISALAFGCASGTKATDGDDFLVLSGGTLIDGTGAPPIDNAAIVVQGDRILHVGAVGDVAIPDGANVMDLKGRYVTAGFIDTHVHSRELDDMGSTLLGFGITTIRSPGDDNGVEMRERLTNGNLVGPTLFTAGRIIDHPGNELPGTQVKLETEPQVREEVRRQAELGVDYVKVYLGVSRQLVEAAIEEAHAHGVRVIGHLHRTSWTEAAESGIDALVHSGSEGPSWELLEDDARAGFPWGDFDGYLRAWADASQRIELNVPQMDRLVRALVDNGVEVNPTLVIMESLYWGNDPEYSARLEPSFAPASLVEGWWGDNWQEGNPFMRQWNFTDEEWAQLKQGFTAAQEMVRFFHDRGVLITAGSDVGMPWITPGVSFHRELELLVQAGIPPRDVLVIATRNGATALGIIDDVGTIEPGKRADLVVLTEDPVLDISNSRSIEAVYLGGRHLDPASLLSQ